MCLKIGQKVSLVVAAAKLCFTSIHTINVNIIAIAAGSPIRCHAQLLSLISNETSCYDNRATKLFVERIQNTFATQKFLRLHKFGNLKKIIN